MAKGKTSSNILRAKLNLPKGLLLGKKLGLGLGDDIPEDVKEGHLAVVASDNYIQLKRFIVPLGFLRHPSFVRLLEKAEEEYGFDHKGALMVPCQPSELERILNEKIPCSEISFRKP
ncbi:auxin-induced protein X15-like [Impatiens glandulifera]|uniref:auxin-induced protein X15-like n=1 Tax=Impatiens glandulifera TaxID=253017 RepID=UPI001FB1003C|nr:auxin-induced protein X15-like [Impatiens glandulifera]